MKIIEETLCDLFGWSDAKWLGKLHLQNLGSKMVGRKFT